MMKKLSCLAAGLCLLAGTTAHAVISVGPTGTGVLTFDTQPSVEDWSSLGIAGGAGNFTTAAALDEDVQNWNAVDITEPLGSSGTIPPSSHALARRNTGGNYIQIRPTGVAYTALLAHLRNDTGAAARYVNISYTFNWVLPAGSVPGEEVPGWRAFYSTSGGAGTWQLIPAFSSVSPGELTATLDLGTWASGAMLYLLWVDDNASTSTTAPNEEGGYTMDNFQVVASSGRDPILANFVGSGVGFTAIIEDGTPPRTVNQSSIAVTVNGQAVTPQISKVGDAITLSYAGNPYTVGTTNDLVFTFADSANPARTYTFNRSYAVAPFRVIPASYAVTGVNTTRPGFTARVHQMPVARGPGDVNSIANAERQLANGFIDPDTGLPYENQADLSTAVNGLFEIPTVINWNQDAPTATGNFSETSNPPFVDDPIPGIPGVNFSTDHIAAEIITFLELKKGAYRMGVNSDDGFKVTVGPNPRDALALILGSFNTGRGVADTLFDFVVEEDGIYPFRLAWWEGTGGAAVEWFTVNTTGQKILINDRSHADGVRAYREGPAGPIFVRSISPSAGFTNAPGDVVLTVVLADAATQVQASTVQMFVNGQPVNATVTKPAGSGDTTITFDPPGVLAPETRLNVRLVYSDNASASRTNEFFVQVRPQVLVDIDANTMWRYSNEGLDLGTEWRDPAYNDSAWPQGAPLLAAETGATAEPIRTELQRFSPDGTQIITDYFRHRFTFSGNPATVQLLLEHVVDDGAVFYLNGVEIHRFGTGAGTVVTAQTTFSGHENTYEGPFAVPSGALLNGVNVLAAEVHQEAATSSDIVFGARLMAAIRTDIPPTSIQSIFPANNAASVSSNATIQVVLTDGTRQVVGNSIQLTINGQTVTPTVTKPQGSIATTVSYAPSGGFTPDSIVNVRLTFADDAATTTTQDFSFTVEPTVAILVGINDTQMWRYSNEGLDLGSAWKERNFNDSAWPQGPALLAFETGATVEPIRTELTRVGADGNNIVTDYFRTRFNFTGDPATARLRLRHVVDDGVAVYLNGVEIHRFFLPETGPIEATTLAVPSDHENRWEGPYLVSAASLVQGENVLAASVHQNAATSSDMVFGLELQVITSTAPQPTEPPQFTSITRGTGTMTINWTGGGTLESAPAITGDWTPVANATSPHTASTTEGSARFFRVRR